MASFKADQRYTHHADDDAQYDSQTSDEHTDEEYIPKTMKRVRNNWKRDYETEIEHLYTIYISHGTMIFGNAFHQLGTMEEFSNFVFKYMQPGAT